MFKAEFLFDAVGRFPDAVGVETKQRPCPERPLGHLGPKDRLYQRQHLPEVGDEFLKSLLLRLGLQNKDFALQGVELAAEDDPRMGFRDEKVGAQVGHPLGFDAVTLPGLGVDEGPAAARFHMGPGHRPVCRALPLAADDQFDVVVSEVFLCEGRDKGPGLNTVFPHVLCKERRAEIRFGQSFHTIFLSRAGYLFCPPANAGLGS